MFVEVGCGEVVWEDQGINLKFDCMWAEIDLLAVTTVVRVTHTVSGK